MDLIKHETTEDQWGYAKRLRFVRAAIEDVFTGREAASLRILDVGCGNGSQLALPLALTGFHVEGIDTDQRSIEHARRLAQGNDNAQFVLGRVEDLPERETYDVVLLSEVLEHMTTPRDLLAASARRMADGGMLIVTVPNGYGEFEVDSWIFRMLRLQKLVDVLARQKHEVLGGTDNLESGHVQFFTRARLRQLFAECDLVLAREEAGSFLAGPIIGHLLSRSTRLIEWNARITDRLPFAMASSWYFALQHRPQTIGDRR
jgi:2-polyprenyl-3-methyl-5-hydroxy-6-metoxy-1,4-benzoquinol methylase